MAVILDKIHMKIIDGDGHINEDSQGIGKHLPKEIFEDERISRISDRWFPPLDHFHAFNGRTPKGSFQRVGPDGWLRFLDEVGIDTTVLYPTLGLSFGNVFHLDWSIALARAYNDWLYETYLKKLSFQRHGLNTHARTGGRCTKSSVVLWRSSGSAELCCLQLDSKIIWAQKITGRSIAKRTV